MSEFQVNIVKIDEVSRHPNADTLIVCKIGGYETISSDIEPGVERYKKGDYVAYIPEGAVVPEYLLKLMGFWNEEKGVGYLSGSRGNRVKAIRLRGIFSQGIMYPIAVKPGFYVGDEPLSLHLVIPFGSKPGDDETPNEASADYDWIVEPGQDVAELLGVEKYEPPVPSNMQGKVGSLFGYTKSFDIEALQKNMNVFAEGDEVVVTEKLHGTLAQFGFIRNLPEDKQEDAILIISQCPFGSEEIVDGDKVHAYVTSKGLAKSGLVQKNSEENAENIYVRLFKETFKTSVTPDDPFSVGEVIGASLLVNDLERLVIMGEIFGIGVQDLNYGTKPTFKVFAVWIKNIDGTSQYLDSNKLDEWCVHFNLERVPVLYRGPFNMEKMIELRDGKSTLHANTIKEGIVILSVEEDDKQYRGLPDDRRQLKFVSPDYLLRKDGTEFN